MSTLQKFATSLISMLRSDRNAEFPAFLGNLSGTVKADEGGNVYVTLLSGEVRTVYNGKVPNVVRLPVVIGYGGTEKMHILRSRDVFPTAPYPDVPNHAFLHTFPGPDTLPIRGEQFLPGLVTPKSGLTVRIYSCVYELTDGAHALATQDLDLTSSVPGSGALYARLEADNTGAVTISLGSAVDSRAELEFSDIPAADPDKYSLAAVKLYIGQTSILFLPTDTDIIDLRFGKQAITPAVLSDLTDGGTTTLHNHDGRYPREYAGKTAAPTVSDDSGDGYAIGDLWIDETNDKVYQALNVTVGAAVWVEITGGGGGGAWGGITGTLSDQTDLQNALDDKEDAANKVTTMTGNTTSDIVFLTAKAVYDWAVGLFSQIGHSHSAPDASAVTYTPADNNDWNSSTDPGDVDDALNQLADRTKTLEGASGGREVLTADRTYYVRTDGSNSNTGLANTSGGAFLTVQKAVDVVYGLDLSTYNVTIQIADGTYTTPIVLSKPFVGKGDVTIQGNSGTPANVIISTTSSNAFNVSNGAIVTIKDLKIQTTTSGTGIYVEAAIVNFYNLNFGTCATHHMLSTGSALIYGRSNYAISGGALRHWFVTGVATIIVTGVTVTITGTPNFSVAFGVSGLAACLSVYSNTYSGSATGKRYDANMNGVIYTAGATLPGNSAGTTATGGQYA